MLPNRTKPLVVVSYEINSQTELVEARTWDGNRIRIFPGEELSIEGPLFVECPTCGSYHRFEGKTSRYIQKTLGIWPEPRIETEERGGH